MGALVALAFPAIPLIHGLLAGTIAVSSLSVVNLITLADAGITTVKIGRKAIMVEQYLEKHRRYKPSPPVMLCFRSPGSDMVAHFC